MSSSEGDPPVQPPKQESRRLPFDLEYMSQDQIRYLARALLRQEVELRYQDEQWSPQEHSFHQLKGDAPGGLLEAFTVSLADYFRRNQTQRFAFYSRMIWSGQVDEAIVAYAASRGFFPEMAEVTLATMVAADGAYFHFPRWPDDSYVNDVPEEFLGEYEALMFTVPGQLPGLGNDGSW